MRLKFCCRFVLHALAEVVRDINDLLVLLFFIVTIKHKKIILIFNI